MTRNPSFGDCALVISSCDAYEDLWQPFFFLFDKHWPDCPFDVYLVTDGKQPMIPRVRVLVSDKGPSWTDRLHDCVGRLPVRYVMLMLEDFFLRSRVNNTRLLQCLDFALKRNCDLLRLCGPKPTTKLNGNGTIGTSEAWQRYRITTQTGLWRRGYLLEMLRPEMNIWQFELDGTERAQRNSQAIYATWKRIIPYRGWFSHHVVEKGKWLAHEAAICRLRGVPVHAGARGYLPAKQYLIYMSASLFGRAIGALPLPLSERIRRFVRWLVTPLIGGYFRQMRGR